MAFVALTQINLGTLLHNVAVANYPRGYITGVKTPVVRDSSNAAIDLTAWDNIVLHIVDTDVNALSPAPLADVTVTVVPNSDGTCNLTFANGGNMQRSGSYQMRLMGRKLSTDLYQQLGTGTLQLQRDPSA